MRKTCMLVPYIYYMRLTLYLIRVSSPQAPRPALSAARQVHALLRTPRAADRDRQPRRAPRLRREEGLERRRLWGRGMEGVCRLVLLLRSEDSLERDGR